MLWFFREPRSSIRANSANGVLHELELSVAKVFPPQPARASFAHGHTVIHCQEAALFGSGKMSSGHGVDILLNAYKTTL